MKPEWQDPSYEDSCLDWRLRSKEMVRTQPTGQRWALQGVESRGVWPTHRCAWNCRRGGVEEKEAFLERKVAESLKNCYTALGLRPRKTNKPQANYYK